MQGAGGQRLYSDTDLERLRRAKTMRDSGMTLAEIKQLLWILSATSLGNEVEGLAEVLRARLVRRNGWSFPRR